MRKFFILILGILLFSDCKPEDKEPDFATILLRISHKGPGLVSGEKPILAEDQFQFKDSLGQEFSVKTLNYYISNIKLMNKSQNVYYQQVQSYHLVNALVNPNNTEIILKNVPMKKFEEFEISIGVDSIANKGIDKTGALDPGKGMYWSWEDGYKFLEFEGRFKQEGLEKPFLFHIGGNENYKTLNFRFSNLLGTNYDIVKDGQIILEADVSAMFGSPNKVDLKIFNNVMSTAAGADKIAENYKTGFLKLVGAN